MSRKARLWASWVFVLLCSGDPTVAQGVGRPSRRTFRESARTVLAFPLQLYVSFLRSGLGPRAGLIFAILPIGAMAMAYAMLETMRVDYGLNQTQIAALSVYNTIGGAVGCVAGGWLGDRFGVKRMLCVFSC